MSNWVKFVKQIQKELNCTYKEALIEASKRWKKEGAGAKQVVQKVVSKVKHRVEDVGQEVKRRVEGVQMAVKGTRTNLPPKSRFVLAHYGHIPIVEIRVGRAPINKAVSTALKVANKLTRWDEIPFDKLYHLYLILKLKGGRQIFMEKNQEIGISIAPRPYDRGIIIPLPTDRTLNASGMFDLTGDTVGANRVFHYDAFSNNCQMFVIDMLESNHIPISTKAMKFILQDVKTLAHPAIQKIAQKGTDVINRVQTVIEGRGHH